MRLFSFATEVITVRYFVRLTYKGSDFHGWQKQLNAPSIQGSLEEALSKIIGESSELVGCGRTDTGVHAHDYFAHFDIAATVDADNLKYKLNSFLHQHIVVKEIFRVRSEAHARFDATSRSYRYFINMEKEAFTPGMSWYLYNTQLDLGKMNQAAELLLKESDFSAFEKVGSDNKTSICNVTYARWFQHESKLYFEIRADRFLRNMVRAIVGTLIDVGRGKIDLEEFKAVISSKERSKAGASVPAQGLFLWEVTYPLNIRIDE